MLGVFAGEYLCGSQDCRRLAGLQGLGERLPDKSAVLALDDQATLSISRPEGRVEVNSEQTWAALAEVIGEEGYAVTAPPASP